MKKSTIHFFLRIIDINERFNVHTTIGYYNVKLIKHNIYEAEAKANYFRLVTLKMVHPNNREFRSHGIAGTLDKQYVLADNHIFVKSRQRIIFFYHHISLQDWIRQHQLVIGHRLNQELISILRYFCNTYFIYF